MAILRNDYKVLTQTCCQWPGQKKTNEPLVYLLGGLEITKKQNIGDTGNLRGKDSGVIIVAEK